MDKLTQHQEGGVEIKEFLDGKQRPISSPNLIGQKPAKSHNSLPTLTPPFTTVEPIKQYYRCYANASPDKCFGCKTDFEPSGERVFYECAICATVWCDDGQCGEGASSFIKSRIMYWICESCSDETKNAQSYCKYLRLKYDQYNGMTDDELLNCDEIAKAETTLTQSCSVGTQECSQIKLVSLTKPLNVPYLSSPHFHPFPSLTNDV